MTVRALPRLRLKDPDTQKAYDAIREALQEGNGERGDPNNRWLTAADLDGSIKQAIQVIGSSTPTEPTPVDPKQSTVVLTVSPPIPTPNTEFTLTATVSGDNPTGTVTFSKGGASVGVVTMSNGVATLTQSLPVGTYNYTANYAGDEKNQSAIATLKVLVVSAEQGPWVGVPPPAPTSLTAYPEAWAIRLVWEQPVDSGGNSLVPPDYAVTEIWCRTTTSGDKTKVGELAGTTFTFTGLGNDLLRSDDTYYFWVRNRDTENLTSAYTPDNDVGVEGHCKESPDKLITGIIGDITDGTLYEYLGEKIKLLQGPELLPGSVAKRLDDQKGELVQMINEVTVSGNGTLDFAEIWHFDGGVQGWSISGTGASVTMSNGVLVVAAGSTTATVLSPTISVSGPAYHAVRARMKQVKANVADPDWGRTVAYKKSGDSTVHTYTPTTPAADLTGFVDFDWDLAGEDTPIWTVDGTTITQVGFELAAGQTLHFDWIAVGRLAPGASYSQVEAVRVNSNRTIYAPNSGAPNYAGPTSASLGYALRTNDIWFDTATAVFDGSGNLVRGGNKPYYWNGSAWVAVTDERLRVSYTEIWNIANAVAGPTGSASNRISGIASTSTSALTTAQSKASIAQVDSTFAGTYGSLAQRLTGIESSIGGQTNVTASIRELQKTGIGYATLDATGAVFEGNGSFVIYPVATYPDATYPQYAATDRKTIIDSLGVDRWNAYYTGNKATWHTGLPLATAIKQVSVSDGSTTGTIEQKFTAQKLTTDGLLLQYTVKIDTNGWVSGFGLASQPAADGNPFSEFGVRSDRFYVAAPNTAKTLPQNLIFWGSLLTGTTDDGTGKVINRYTTIENGATVYWAYFKVADTTQFKADQWVVLKGLAENGWNTNWLIDHVGATPAETQWNTPLVDRPGTNTVFLKTTVQSEFPSGNGTARIVGNVVAATAQSANIPFIVLTTGRSINGYQYPAGVYATAAYIKKAMITEAAIANAAITNAKIGNFICSVDYNGAENNGSGTGTAGWCINKLGDAVFNHVVVRDGNNIGNNAFLNLQPLTAFTYPSHLNTGAGQTSPEYTIGTYTFKAATGKSRALLFAFNMDCAIGTTKIEAFVYDSVTGQRLGNKVLYSKAGGAAIGSRYFSTTTAWYVNAYATGWRFTIQCTMGGTGGSWGDLELTILEIQG